MLKSGKITVDLVFAYVFVLLNTLQGVTIFLAHVLLHEKIRNEWIEAALRQRWLPYALQIQLRKRNSTMTSSNNKKSVLLFNVGPQSASSGESKQDNTNIENTLATKLQCTSSSVSSNKQWI